MSVNPVSDRQSMRQSMRQCRRALDHKMQHRTAHQLLRQFQRDATIKKSQRIALYLPHDGEINPLPTIHWLWQQGKALFLPVLHPFNQHQLLFLRYNSTTAMIKNRYGIAEPQLDVRHVIPCRELDLIITPLVAFDLTGNRLGMGGGYYDRTLAYGYHHSNGAQPTIIGIAHDCQQQDRLPIAPWDIPLSQLITPSRILHFP